MLKKFFVFTTLICFLGVQAHAATNNGLKAAFDELNYALTVEWDQSDKAFYSTQMEKFQKNLTSLQKEGVTNQEIVDLALSQVKDEKLAKDLRTAFTMIAINKMNSSEAQNYVTDIMNKSYHQGASWNGSVVVTVLVVLVVVAAVALASGSAKVDDGCYQVYTCEDYCSLGVCYEDCSYKCI